MGSRQAKNFQLVEAFKPATLIGAGNKLYFTDQPQLRSIGNRLVQVVQISAYCVLDVPVSPGGNPICTAAQFINAFLVLNIMGVDKYLYIPLAQLRSTSTNAVADAPHQVFPFTLEKQAMIDWSKSYLQFGQDPGNTAYSYLFGVWYYNLPDDMRPLVVPGLEGVQLVA